MSAKITVTDNVNWEPVKNFPKPAVRDATLIVENTMKEFNPVDTGRSRAAWWHRIRGLTGTVTNNVKYVPLLILGTGLFGPKHQRIYPRKAKALSWVPRGGIRMFAKSTKGMRPKFKFKNAMNESVKKINLNNMRLAGQLGAKYK